MSRPSVSTVRNWYVLFDSDKVRVESEFPEGGAWFKVVPAGGKVKYFYGESAWSDAQRMASDLDFAAYGFMS
jgi:hypothetical protein